MRRLRELAGSLFRPAAGLALLAAAALPSDASQRETTFADLVQHPRFQAAFVVEAGTIDLRLDRAYRLVNVVSRTPLDPDNPEALARSNGMVLTVEPPAGSGYRPPAVVWEPDRYLEANEAGKVLFAARSLSFRANLRTDREIAEKALADMGIAEAALYDSRLAIEGVVGFWTSFGAKPLSKVAEVPLKKLTKRQWWTIAREVKKESALLLGSELAFALKDFLADDGRITNHTEYKEAMYSMLRDGAHDLRTAEELANAYAARTSPFTPADAALLRNALLLGKSRVRAAKMGLGHQYPQELSQALSNFLLNEVATSVASGATFPVSLFIDYESFVDDPESGLAVVQKAFDEETEWFDAQFGRSAAYGGVDLVLPVLQRIRAELDGGYATPEALVRTYYTAVRSGDPDAVADCFADTVVGQRRAAGEQPADAWKPARVSGTAADARLQVSSWRQGIERVEEWTVAQDSGLWKIERIRQLRTVPAPPPAVPAPTIAPAFDLSFDSLKADPRFLNGRAIGGLPVWVRDADGTVYTAWPLYGRTLDRAAGQEFLAVNSSGIVADDPLVLSRVSFAAQFAQRARTNGIGQELAAEAVVYRKLLALDEATDDAAYLRARLPGILESEWEPGSNAALDPDSRAITGLLPLGKPPAAFAEKLKEATAGLDGLREAVRQFAAEEVADYRTAAQLSALIRQAKGTAFAAALAAYSGDALPAGLADQPAVPSELRAYAGGLNNRMERLEQLFGGRSSGAAGASVAGQLRGVYESARTEALVQQRVEELRRQIAQQYAAQPQPPPPERPQQPEPQPEALPAEIRDQLYRNFQQARELVDQNLRALEWAYRNDPGSGVTAQELQEYRSIRDDLGRYGEKAFADGALTAEEVREFNGLVSRLRARIAR